ncbi:hypothetical protein RSOLAG1IB_05740 [Rhizoctonia solani AG-1 IB]|uniref:Uncharacterized protein n=1 Tax=Thanatephorus cucumeris (strain AG1-IB / isolate 7/3/14) TaxID=1108050 RepID=A0A0B7F3A1_THACB|nr:hypothetical protein RSOLAG1IB_05740 [Rhizoctonia solani AG-1 IB]
MKGSRQNTRQSVVNHSATRPDGGLSDTWSLFEQIQPKYKANVVVWAASEAYGSAYSEEDLPEKLGVYSIMVGAIFSAFGSKGRKVTRQEIWEDVWRVYFKELQSLRLTLANFSICRNIVEKHNNTRRERDSRKPPEKREILSMKSRIQRPVLLTSVESPEWVLNGRMFQPISKGRRKPQSRAGI